MANALILLAGGFAAAWVVERIVLAVTVRRGLLIAPNERSSHTTPTPGIGGIAVVIPVLLWAASAMAHGDGVGTAVFVGGGALALLGLFDDLHTLPAHTRLPVHAAAVGLALWLLPLPGHLSVAPIVLAMPWVVASIVALGLLWLINLYNFMDGIDGYAGAQCLVFCGGALLLGAGEEGIRSLLLVLAGATLGFLWFNWSPARIFLGDVGSGFIGFTIGVVCLALDESARVPFVATLLLLTGFWFDATYTLCVRILTGQRFAAAHRSHLYQKLSRRIGHAAMTGLLVGYGMTWLLPLAWISTKHPQWQLLCVVAAAAPMAVACVWFKAGMSEPGPVAAGGVR